MIKYNLLIYDVFPIIEIGLDVIIKDKYEICDVYLAKTANKLISFTTMLAFNLIFVDIVDNGFNDFSLLKKLREIQPNPKLIVLSLINSNGINELCFNNDSDALLNKSYSEEAVCQIIDVFLFEGSSDKIFQNFTLKETLILRNFNLK